VLTYKPAQVAIRSNCHYGDKTNLLAVTKGAWTRVPVLEWDGEVVYNSATSSSGLDARRRRIADSRRLPAAHRAYRQLGRHTFFHVGFVSDYSDLLDGVGDAKLKANREKLIGNDDGADARAVTRR